MPMKRIGQGGEAAVFIVDFHTHLGKGEPDAEPLQRDQTPQKLLRLMDEAGVDVAVSFPVTYRDYAKAHEELRSYADAFKGRIIPFARVGDTDDAVDILDHAVNSLGFKGLKIHMGCDNIPPDSPRLARVLRRAEELNIPVLFDALGEERAAAVCRLVSEYKFPAILGHMGGLWNVRAIEICISCAEENENVYLETSSMLLWEKIEEAVKRVGAGRILFGSDAPAVHPRPEVEKILALHIRETDKRAILGENAKRLLGL